jgi:hypothetical protein
MRYKLTPVTIENFQEGVPVVVFPISTDDMEFKPQTEEHRRWNQYYGPQTLVKEQRSYYPTNSNRLTFNPNPSLGSTTSIPKFNNSGWQVGINPIASRNMGYVHVDPYVQRVESEYKASHPLIKDHFYVGADALPSQIYIVFKSEKTESISTRNVFFEKSLNDSFGKLSLNDVESFQNKLALINKESLIEDYFDFKKEQLQKNLASAMQYQNSYEKFPFAFVLCYFEEQES